MTETKSTVPPADEGWETPGNADEFFLLGLDGEMSAADLAEGGRLIQAGFAVRTTTGIDVFSELISWDDMAWSERAAQVHQLDIDQVRGARRADEVDEAAYEWLVGHGAVPGTRQVVSVGFNVAAFDHPFFRHALPRTMALVSRRAIDLNAVCFTLSGWDPGQNDARAWTGWKRSAKKAGTAALGAVGVTGHEHDAGYDAALAITSWEFLRDEIHRCGVRPPALEAGVDPVLAAVLGSGLARRTRDVPVQVLRRIVGVLVGEGIPAGVFFSSRYPALGGRTVLQALLDGQHELVLSLLHDDRHQ